VKRLGVLRESFGGSKEPQGSDVVAATAEGPCRKASVDCNTVASKKGRRSNHIQVGSNIKDDTGRGKGTYAGFQKLRPSGPERGVGSEGKNGCSRIQ